MNIEEIKVSVITLTDYEKEQITKFLGSTSCADRKKICSKLYDDVVLSELYNLLVNSYVNN